MVGHLNKIAAKTIRCLPMRFRFCGGLEPPDWLLAEVSLLSRLSPSATAGLCTTISDDIAAAPDRAVEQATELFPASDDDQAAARAAVAALRFVLGSAAKYDTDGSDLLLELQQLGLDKALAETAAQSYEASRAHIREQQREQSFAFAHPEKIVCAVRRPPETQEPEVELRMRLSEPATMLAGSPPSTDIEVFVVGADKFLALEEDLRHALSTLQSVRL